MLGPGRISVGTADRWPLEVAPEILMKAQSPNPFIKPIPDAFSMNSWRRQDDERHNLSTSCRRLADVRGTLHRQIPAQNQRIHTNLGRWPRRGIQPRAAFPASLGDRPAGWRRCRRTSSPDVAEDHSPPARPFELGIPYPNWISGRGNVSQFPPPRT